MYFFFNNFKFERERLPVYEYLYRLKDNSTIAAQNIEQELKAEKENERPFINKTSNEIYSIMIQEKMKALFEELDSDSDGLISAKNMNLKSI